jgi:hypothetical protein
MGAMVDTEEALDDAHGEEDTVGMEATTARN